MKTLREIRLALHLTQSTLATMLGVSRGRIAMAETGKRGLPVECWTRLAELQSSEAGNELETNEMVQVAVQQEYSSIRHEYQTELAAKELEKAQLETDLQRMQCDHTKATTAMNALIADQKDFENIPTHLARLDQPFLKALDEFRSTHPCRQQLLTGRIQSIADRIAYINMWLQTFNETSP